MRLKSLKIFGFKSFADKTLIHFHDGITGIVGPNGCGKSNTADAIRWVLGEQSAKSMRGNRMPDIIFAGTGKRKPLNICEVAITFINDKGILPIDFEEVEVARRLHRSGESEYLINGQQVRLKDVHDLFLETGVGKNSFAIFEQGKIEQVINYSPVERRTIFEDAAGILRFLVEKQRAIRKLEHVDNNMARVQDIHKEVERQIVIKEKQVEKAKAYKKNRIEFETLEKGLFITRWDRLDKKRQTVEQRQGQGRENLLQSNAKLEKFLQDLCHKKEQLEEGEEELRRQNENVYKTRSQREIKMRETHNDRLRIEELTQKEVKWKQDLETLEAFRQKREEEKARHIEKQQELEANLAGLEQVTKEQWESVCAIEHQLVELRKEQQRAHHEYVVLMQSEKQIDSEFKQHSVRLEHNHERKNQLHNKREQQQKHLADLAQLIIEKEQALREANQDIEDQKAQLKHYEDEVFVLKQNAQSLRSEIEQLRKQQAEAEARYKVLKKLREEMEGFSPGTKKLLQESTKPNSPIFNKLRGLYELITPKPGGEAAVSAVMKPYTQTLVAQNEDDFLTVLEFAKEQSIKDFSILYLEQVDKTLQAASYATLLTKVLDTAISRHFLSNIAIAETPIQALQLAKDNPNLEIWTEDGAYVDGKRVIFYVKQGQNNAFLREAELKALDKTLSEINQTFKTKEEKLADLNHEIQALDQQRYELDKAIRHQEMKVVEVKFAYERAKSDREKNQLEFEKIDQEIAAAEEAIRKYQQNLVEVEQRHLKAQEEAEQHKQQSLELQQKVEAISKTLKEEQAKLKEKENHHQGVIEEHRKVIHALNVLEVQDLESVQQQKRLEQEIESGKKVQEELIQKLEEDSQYLDEIKKTLVEVESISIEMQETVQKSKQAIAEIDGMLEGARQEIKQHESSLYEVGIEMTQIESGMETIQNELRERHNLEIEELRKQGVSLEVGTEEAEKQLRRLRRLLDDSGDINMASIDEYEELKERYQFLNQQLDDLAVSKQELMEIITKLDQESRKLFEETFTQVRANFQRNFAILFNGGEADLRFTEAEDVLEAGIDIVAKPPGKQMRNISLLSGGEKCLTSMALLFAIFEVKTAPFCILDEVDAPLDDTNISRFVNVIKQFTDSCQFVVITHNKRTMSICDRLYGVSMQERGISKLLSIEFSHDKAPEPMLVE